MPGVSMPAQLSSAAAFAMATSSLHEGHTAGPEKACALPDLAPEAHGRMHCTQC